MTVRITARARQQALHADKWWRQNRPSAPELFVDELAAAFERLSASPQIGVPFPDTEVPDVRRMLLVGSRYHVYYFVDAASEEVVVLAIWSAIRGRTPSL